LQLNAAASDKFLFFLGSSKEVQSWCHPARSGSGKHPKKPVDHDEYLSMYAKPGHAYDSTATKLKQSDCITFFFCVIYMLFGQ